MHQSPYVISLRAKHFHSASANFPGATKYSNCCHVSEQAGSSEEFVQQTRRADLENAAVLPFTRKQ